MGEWVTEFSTKTHIRWLNVHTRARTLVRIHRTHTAANGEEILHKPQYHCMMRTT